MAIVKLTPVPIRFARHWVENRETGCHEWLGAKDGHGYGQLRVGDKARLATHIALEFAGLPRPSPKACALHRCDNPACVNPKHLWWGTLKENTRDAMNKGRMRLHGLAGGHAINAAARAASTVNCDNCGLSFKSKPSRIKVNKRNFCGLECTRQWQSKNFTGTPRSEFGQPVTVCRSLMDIDETLGKWGWV